MSYIFLQEQGGVSSVDNFSDIPQYVQSRLNLTAEKSSSKDNETASCQNFQFGTMSEPSTANLGEDSSTSSVAASLAKTYPTQNQTQKVLWEREADYGVKWRELLVKFDQNTLSWKTAQLSLFEDLTPCSPTLPFWGIMWRGALWAGETTVKRTANEFGFWGSPSATEPINYKFSKEQILKSKYGNTVNRYSTQCVRSIGYLPSVEFPEWIMNFPIGWTDLKPLAMDKYRQWQRQHLQS